MIDPWVIANFFDMAGARERYLRKRRPAAAAGREMWRDDRRPGRRRVGSRRSRKVASESCVHHGMEPSASPRALIIAPARPALLASGPARVLLCTHVGESNEHH